MERVSRGGFVMRTGEIGYPMVIRQQLLMPGETMRTYIEGVVRMEALRERDTSRINARIDCFAQPLRWLYSDISDLVREGPNSTKRPPKAAIGHQCGVGQVSMAYRFFRDAIIKIYNEHYKWPEANDVTTWPVNGHPLVPLPMPWNRLRDSDVDDDDDTVIDASSSEVDVREIAEMTATFQNAITNDFLSFDRFLEIMRSRYGAKGSIEVDQVPMHINHIELGVRPHDYPATDGASLGQFASLYDFYVDYDAGVFTAPEHFVLTWILSLRFASISESDSNYQAIGRDWHSIAMDPKVLAAQRLQPVQRRDLFGNSAAQTVDGYLPAGWQAKTEWNHVGDRIDARNSFPFYRDLSQKTRDASQITNSFRSTSLRDYVAQLYCHQMSMLPLMGGQQLGTGFRVGDIEPDRLV